MHLKSHPLLVLLALQHGEKTLMNTNVLLLRLDHPNTLLSHLVDDTEDVNNIVFSYPLE